MRDGAEVGEVRSQVVVLRPIGEVTYGVGVSNVMLTALWIPVLRS